MVQRVADRREREREKRENEGKIELEKVSLTVSLAHSLSLHLLFFKISPPLHDSSTSCSHKGRKPPMK